MATIQQLPAHPAGSDAVRNLTSRTGPAPLMGSADPGVATPLMGSAALGTAAPLMGRVGPGSIAPLMGSAAPGIAIALMGPAAPGWTPLMCPPLFGNTATGDLAGTRGEVLGTRGRNHTSTVRTA